MAFVKAEKIVEPGDNHRVIQVHRLTSHMPEPDSNTAPIAAVRDTEQTRSKEEEMQKLTFL